MVFLGTFNTGKRSAGEQIAHGVVNGINDWAKRKIDQQTYEQQIAAQVAGQERLMQVAHQQKLQEMAYQKQIKTRKKVVVYHLKTTHPTNEIATLPGPVIVVSVIAILFITGMAAVILLNPNKN